MSRKMKDIVINPKIWSTFVVYAMWTEISKKDLSIFPYLFHYNVNCAQILYWIAKLSVSICICLLLLWIIDMYILYYVALYSVINTLGCEFCVSDLDFYLFSFCSVLDMHVVCNSRTVWTMWLPTSHFQLCPKPLGCWYDIKLGGMLMRGRVAQKCLFLVFATGRDLHRVPLQC